MIGHSKSLTGGWVSRRGAWPPCVARSAPACVPAAVPRHASSPLLLCTLLQAGFALKSLMVSSSAATVFGLAGWMLFQGPAGPALSFLVCRRAGL